MNCFVVFSFFVAVLFVVCSAIKLPYISKEDFEAHTWVLDVSGASGWYDYRMQADVCHAYHVFHEIFGIPDERIIVMMVDDIVNDSSNPFPGIVINDIGGKDVYAGVPHDYNGGTVTPENFQKLMTGEFVDGGSGKTLKSTSEDNVFIYFSDHGLLGGLCFPWSMMKKDMIQNALQTMAQKQMYKNVIFYVDACYSGSIFYDMQIPDNMYIVSACGIHEVTYSCNYDSDLKNYPCTEFSHAWITDVEQNNNPNHTFYQQFLYILNNTLTFSRSCQYGAVNQFNNATIDWFFLHNTTTSRATKSSVPVKDGHGPVVQYDVPLALAQHLFESDPSEKNRQKLQRELTIRKVIDIMNAHIIEAAKPGISVDTLTQCTTCDSSCPCYQYCIKRNSVSHCQSECCDGSDKCNIYNYKDATFGKCVDILEDEYVKTCGFKHAYLRKADGMFYSLCQRGGVNIEAAVQEIHKQCSMFKQANF